MKQSRRKFILATGSALAGGAFQRSISNGGTTGSAPDITALLEASGFTPGNPNSALLAVIGDVHINLKASDPKFTDRFDDALVAELNGLAPAITDLAIAGDLIIHHSVSIGGNRYPNDYEMSRLEFRTTKAQIARFRPDMRFYAVPGNHDTDRFEVDAELWRKEVQLPPYQKSILGGVPVFFLNSGHAGMLDPTQRTWFETQVALLSPDQEVVIIAHHPSFFSVWGETGLKKISSLAFANHRAPVWLIGGHGHAFAEQLLVAGSARFIQMEVTTGNPKLSGDGRNPGYVLLALQDGHVVQRHFRSINEPGFQTRAPLDQLISGPVKWVFDTVEFPAALFEEGFYSRSGNLIGFDGKDLRTYFSLCRSHTVRVSLSTANGKITQYLIAAKVWTGYAPPTCDFSTTGVNGPWVSVSFPNSTGNQIYQIPIPIQFRNAASLYIRTRTQLQGPNDGIEIYGWGLAAEASALTGYEKWLATHYRTFLHDDQTHPVAVPEGSSLTNLEHFAFNIPLPAGVSKAPVSSSQPILPPGLPIQGGPAYSRILTDSSNTYAFARRKSANRPGITTIVEESADLRSWSPVDPARLTVTSLDATWEEVRLTEAVANGYFRVRLEKVSDSQGSFLPWQNSVAIPTGSPADRNANSIDDLIEYGFDLNPSEGSTRPYDPERAGNPAGQPNIRARGRMTSRIVFARMKASATPGVLYLLEQSPNLVDWYPVPQDLMTERILKSDTSWEQVECLLDDASQPRMFYRTRVELSQPLLQQVE